MNRKLMMRIGLLAVSIALSAMGCWFCWNCPMDWLYGPNRHFAFERQVVWNALGLALFAVASMVPWKWWRKSAPWLLVVWLLLAFYAVFLGRPVNGAYRWADFGFVRVNLRTFSILVAALFAAWLCSKKHVRPWMIFAFMGVGFAFCVYRLVGNEVRLERITSFFDHDHARYYGAWMHCQLKAAFRSAHWFGGSGLSLRFLPNPLNDGMASAAALIFGRWFPVAVFGLFAVMGGLLSALYIRIRGVSERMFILFWGVGMVLPAIYGFFQCVGCVPVTGFSPVLAGYGGTGIAVFYLGLGVLFSLLRKSEIDDAGKWGGLNAVVWCGLFAAFCGGVALAMKGTEKFRTPVGDQGVARVCPSRGWVFDCQGQVLSTNGMVTADRVFAELDDRSMVVLAHNRPERGGDVVLTIDRDIQSALQAVLEKYADTNDTGRAWGVVMEPETGAIRAMACTGPVPEIGGMAYAAYASSSVYELGHAITPFTAAIAIDGGLAGIDTMYSTDRDDARYSRLPGDGGRVWPAEMSVGDAVVRSSNIVLGKLACDIGPERLYRGLKAFGFGEKSGSECVLEAEGVFRDCRGMSANKVLVSRMGIGQGFAGTALQLARGYAILAGGGMDVRPYVVEKIVAADGKAECHQAPSATNRVVSALAAAAVCRTLERVTTEGTARRAAVEGVRVAGKTGTTMRMGDGKYLDDVFRATFAGFFPADRPKYVLVMTFETKRVEGSSMHQGGRRPALAFAELVRGILKR